jgi:hypothetical protein
LAQDLQTREPEGALDRVIDMDMDMDIDIIPISSRRRAQPPRAVPPEAVRAASPGGRWRFALAVGAALSIAGAVVVSRVQTIGSIRGLPPAQRAELYHRTFDDAAGACAIPDARAGALRDHCVGQAEFLQLFPECDVGCQKLTASILPRARR